MTDLPTDDTNVIPFRSLRPVPVRDALQAAIAELIHTAMHCEDEDCVEKIVRLSTEVYTLNQQWGVK